MDGKIILLLESNAAMATSNDPEVKGAFEDDFNPPICQSISPLQDSRTYLNKLEIRLKKIKGNTSKELFLKGLHEMKESHMHQLINQTIPNETSEYLFTDNSHELSSEISYIERKLFPEKTAISAEELYALIERDILAKETAELQASDELECELPEK